jgi:hypothetical protein
LFEILLDFTNGHIDYPMIISMIIGLAFPIIWKSKIEFKFVQNIHSTSDIQIVKNKPFILKAIIYVDQRLIWIVKIIRKKENTSEEPALSISCPII